MIQDQRREAIDISIFFEINLDVFMLVLPLGATEKISQNIRKREPG
jgi:hypothetical protein